MLLPKLDLPSSDGKNQSPAQEASERWKGMSKLHLENTTRSNSSSVFFSQGNWKPCSAQKQIPGYGGPQSRKANCW